MTQNILTCFKFITIINIINYVIIKNTFIINYLLICTLIGIFYIVTNLEYIIFISLSYIIIKYIIKKKTS